MNQERLLTVLLSPYVTNKADYMADKFSYAVFKVATNAKKKEIKQAVELLFEVKVEAVKTVNVKGKSRRFSRVKGRTKNWKKAYVRLQKGHDISFMDAE